MRELGRTESAKNGGVRDQRTLSFKVLLIFLAVVLLCTLQLCWWITFQILETGKHLRERQEEAKRDLHVAAELIRLRVGGALEDVRKESVVETLDEFFPHLKWEERATSASGSSPTFSVGQFVVDPDFLEQLRSRRNGRIRMFVSEGMAFLAVLVLGVLMIYRTLRREVRLQRQQSNFLAAVTHELKSPLAAIRLMTETLGRLSFTEEKRKEYLHLILLDVDRLAGLVNNILSVARIEAGNDGRLMERTDLAQEVLLCRDVLQEMLAERGTRIELRLPDEEVPVMAASESLQTVIRNLIENAAKYGGDTDSIEVSLTLADGRAILEVRDRGIGLSKGDCQRVFDKFFRVGDEMVRQVPGSGLGLYLVRALVSECGGDVSAASEGVGKGTVFRVRLPLHLEGEA